MIVGGGPAGMSAAIRLKQLANEVQGVLQFLARSDDRSNIRDIKFIFHPSLVCLSNTLTLSQYFSCIFFRPAMRNFACALSRSLQLLVAIFFQVRHVESGKIRSC